MATRSTILWLLRSPWTLAAAAVLVGVAIVWDGAAAKAFNGIGGLVWVGCAIALATELRRDRSWRATGAVVLGLAILFAVVVRPSDGLIAAAGFGLGGALIASIARGSQTSWAVLLPAMWLPVHLAVAVGRASYRTLSGGESAIRTDPPPTAAVVPLLMVLAAWGGGWMAVYLKDQRRGSTRTVVSRT